MGRPLADESRTDEPLEADSALAEPDLLKIGEVAERVGLSLRTIRFYEEEGLVLPETRTAGGFRLYARAAVGRLHTIKRLKPLGFSVEEMAEVLATLDGLAAGDAADDTAGADRDALRARLEEIRARVEARAEELLAEAARARELGFHLRELAERHR